MARPIRVLVVDDSAFMRKVISDILSADPDLEIVATARDGQDGVEKALSLQPDVVTLDVEMPKLDGFGVLREIMSRRPTPVVMVSSLTQEGAEATIRALALGAVDFVGKPSGSISLNMVVVREELVQKVKAAAGATPRYRHQALELPPVVKPAAPRPSVAGAFHRSSNNRLVVIGCSTGGPGALHQIIPRLPADLPAPVLVVQHMPPNFTRSLADRLNEVSRVTVKEAAQGDPLVCGQVLVAPGGYHMTVSEAGRVELNQDPPQHGVRPAVDVTLHSVVPRYGNRLVGVILTGMGYDGAKGMMALKKAGGRTIAEDASTCVVYGMPKVVVELGAADQVLPVFDIADGIVAALG